MYIINTGFCVSVMKFSYLKGRRVSSLSNCYLSEGRRTMCSLHFTPLFPTSQCAFKFLVLWQWFLMYRIAPLAFDFIHRPTFSVVLRFESLFCFHLQLTLRRLMSYIHMEHPFLMFLDHTQRRSTVGRTPLDEWSARPEESYRLCCVVVCDLET